MSSSARPAALPLMPSGGFCVRNLFDVSNTVAQLISAHLKRLQPDLQLPAVWAHLISKVTLKLYDVDAKPQRVQFVLAMLRDGLCPVSAGKMYLLVVAISTPRYACRLVSTTRLQWSTVLPSLSLRTIELLKLLFGMPFPESEPAASASPPPSDRRKSVIVVEMKALKLADPARSLIEALSYGSASEVAMLTSVKAELLPLDRRDLLYKEIFTAQSKGLRRAVDDDSCMVLLKSRGLSKTKLTSVLYSEHLRKWQASAVRRYLSNPKFANLAITGGDGNLCHEDGLFLPALSPKGQIAGGQIKPFVVQPDRPRYHTLGCGLKKSVFAQLAKAEAASAGLTGRNATLPFRCYLLPSGAAPHHVWIPKCASVVGSATAGARKPPTVPVECFVIGLCEGGLKPLIAAAHLRHPFIGAWGADFHNAQVHEFVVEIERYHFQITPGSAQIRLFPDAGTAVNPQISTKLLTIGCHLFEMGYRVTVAWWGQTFKTAEDFTTASRDYEWFQRDEESSMFPSELRSCDIDDVFVTAERARVFRPLFLTMQQYLAKCSPTVQSDVTKHVTVLGAPLVPTVKRVLSLDATKPSCTSDCPARKFVCECLKLETQTEALATLAQLCALFFHDGDALLSEILTEKDRISSLLLVQCRLIAAVTGGDIPSSPAPVTDAESVCSLWHRCQRIQSDAVSNPSDKGNEEVPCVLREEFVCDGTLGGREGVLTSGMRMLFLHEIVSDESQCGAGWAAVCSPHNHDDVFIVPYLFLTFPTQT